MGTQTENIYYDRKMRRQKRTEKKKEEEQVHMTEQYNRYKIRETDHSKFGGIIYPSDFNTNCRGKNSTYGSPTAMRIISDRKFDEQCRKGGHDIA